MKPDLTCCSARHACLDKQHLCLKEPRQSMAMHKKPPEGIAPKVPGLSRAGFEDPCSGPEVACIDAESEVHPASLPAGLQEEKDHEYYKGDKVKEELEKEGDRKEVCRHGVEGVMRSRSRRTPSTELVSCFRKPVATSPKS
jgi:hypothetical protein